jgi:hypothetical protein
MRVTQWGLFPGWIDPVQRRRFGKPAENVLLQRPDHSQFGERYTDRAVIINATTLTANLEPDHATAKSLFENPDAALRGY